MPKVHIRKRALTKGRHSLFLDFSPALRNPKNGKPQRFEFLDLFIYDKPSDMLAAAYFDKQRHGRKYPGNESSG